MKRPTMRLVATAVAVAAGAFAPRPVHGQSAPPAPLREKPDSGRYGYTKADVAFMSGMIHHHAQALIMARWADSHGASPSLAILCHRIFVGQSAEIDLMERWLRDRHEPVPDTSSKQMMAGMSMPGMAMDSLMPGMLSPAQMDTLNKARGVDFDRYFLRYMIQHHTGAIQMVTTLFNSYGAGQDDVVFKFATAVNVDQMTEIDRMNQMLSSLPGN